MKLVTAEAIREADRKTIEELDFPGIALMENAGMRITEAVISIDPLPRNIVILAGPGNNGGDGLVTARHLDRLGFRLSVWCTAPAESYKGDALTNLNFLEKKGLYVRYVQGRTQMGLLEEQVKNADLVVDALLGTGTKGTVEGIIAQVIEMVNVSGTPVLSVDMPSGIDSDSGIIHGIAMRAWWTVTFAFPKRGLLLFPGADFAGWVTVADIDIPDKVLPFEGVEVVTAPKVKKLLPVRPRDAHKGTFGKTMIVAGSPGMSGAAVLAAESALRGGAGLVYIASAGSICNLIESKMVEGITLELPESKKGIVAEEAAGIIMDQIHDCRVLLVGPGLTPGEDTYKLLEILIPNCPIPMIFDAGALTALSMGAELLLKAQAPVIITPHPGEMARLTGLKINEVEEDRLGLPAKMAKVWKFVVVLKGAPSVVALPDGTTWVNPTGGPVLSTAGTGDILCGLIAGLVSQGLSVEEAAICGTFVHGLAGDLISGEGLGIKAGDILLRLPQAFSAIAKRRWEPSLFGAFHRDIRPRFKPE